MTRVSLVLCTVPAAEAEGLVDRLLGAGLIACANMIGPVRSRYRWEGAIETSEETLLLLKTPSESVAQLTQKIAEWHPYELPEVLAFSADSGLEAYLAWVHGSCSPSDS